MTTQKLTDRQIKTEATQREYARVYDNMCWPPQDIYAECSDGDWVRRAWTGVSMAHGWSKWEKVSF